MEELRSEETVGEEVVGEEEISRGVTATLWDDVQSEGGLAF